MSKWYVLIFAVAVAFGLGEASAQEKPKVSKQIVENITKALPDEAPAKPAKQRRVLVFTLATGFVHGSIPVAATAFEMMGKKTGAYEAVISSDPAMFEEDKLKAFDAVLLVSTTGEGFGLRSGQFAKLPAAKQAYYERLRKNLLDYVGRGKGLMGIHAATDSAYEWREYGKLIGGYFDKHPFRDITMKLDDPTSPINACFKGQPYTISDEIYVFREEPYSRDRLHILLSIDVSKTKLNSHPRKDDDYAVSWIQKVGSGRVFYCSLGHENATFFNPVIMQHYLAGLQFALGDLEADTTPSNKK